MIEDGGPADVDQRLPDTVVEQILAESRARIQPYFVAPTVRPRPDPAEADRQAYEHRGAGVAAMGGRAGMGPLLTCASETAQRDR